MNQTTNFYEFLVRGDKDGHVAGVHVGYRTLFFDDEGKEFHEKILPPQEVSVTDKDKLSEIAGEINTASLATIELLQSKNRELTEVWGRAEADAQSKAVQIADLEKQLAAASATPEPAPEKGA